MNCRLCSAKLETRIFHLDDMPLTDEFVVVKSPRPEFIADIDIFKCNSCGLVQNPVDFDHEGYYETYEYSSGHSTFTKRFMAAYAKATVDAFLASTGRPCGAVLEVGSGDGEQLRAFADLGVKTLLGVEPSAALVAKSLSVDIPAIKGFFAAEIVKDLPAQQRYDVCISSYTLDHVRNPADYLRTAHGLLVPGGIVAFEVHDLEKISERSEWCLFEHEHTIYMDAAMAREIVQRNGFEVVSINPLNASEVRANSLIVIAKKVAARSTPSFVGDAIQQATLQARIDATMAGIDRWITERSPGDRVVGYGAGGRGVMTLAALRQYARFETVFDSNYRSGRLLMPKTHLPVSGLDRLGEYRDAWCVVFSFGYLAEITATLVENGFEPHKIVSLESFYAQANR